MFKRLMSLVRGRRAAQVLLMDHPSFGRIAFFPGRDSAGIWQMHDPWPSTTPGERLSCGSIPGTADGPFAEAERFLLQKREDTEQVWQLCAGALEDARKRWRTQPSEGPLREAFVLTSLGLEAPITHPPTWEVGFEDRDGRIVVWVTFVGDRQASVVCDT